MIPGAFTYFVDFKLASTPGAGAYYCVSQFPTDATHAFVLLLMNVGGYPKWCFGVCPAAFGTAGQGNSTALDTTRHCAVITFDGVSTYTLHIDGVSQTVSAAANGAAWGGALLWNLMGERGGADAYLDGTIYAHGLYNTALTPTQAGTLCTALMADMAAATSTVVDAVVESLGTLKTYQRFNSGQSGDVFSWADQGSAVNDLTQSTLAQQAYFDVDDSVGDLHEVMYCPLASTNMKTAAIATLSGATALTISFWVRAANPPSALNSLFAWDGVAPGVPYGFVHNADGTIYFRAYTGAVEAKATFPVSPTTWKRVTVVFNGAGGTNDERVQTYVGSTQQSPTFLNTFPATLYAGTWLQYIGYTASSLTARYDDIVGIKRALTAPQVAQLATYYTRSG